MSKCYKYIKYTTTDICNKFNEKYSEISESEKKIIKSVLNGDKEKTFNTLIRECIDSVDKKLNESSDFEIKDKLLKVKDKFFNSIFLSCQSPFIFFIFTKTTVVYNNS